MTKHFVPTRVLFIHIEPGLERIDVSPFLKLKGSVKRRLHSGDVNYEDVASDVGVNFKNVGVLSIESSLFHLFHYTFLQTKHQRKGY